MPATTDLASPAPADRVRRRALGFAAVTGGALAVSSALASVQGYPVICLVRRLTGLPCPSCGMTRAFLALGHGRLREALGFNLASPMVYAAAWLVLGLSVAELARGEALLAPLWGRVRRGVVPAVLGLLAVAWARNLWVRLAGG